VEGAAPSALEWWWGEGEIAPPNLPGADGAAPSMNTAMQAAVTGSGLVLPPDPVDDSRALGRVYARYLAACVQQFLSAGSQLPAALRPAHARIAALVRQGLAHNQRAMLSCFASPTVGTPLQCLGLRDDLEAFRRRIDDAGTKMLPHLLFEMALRRLIPDGRSVLWEHGAPPLASLAIGGELIPPAGATGWRFSASHLAAIGRDTELARLPVDREAMQRTLADGACGVRIEPRFHRVGAVTYFATVDHNPIAAFEAHPDKAGNHVDLGGRPEAEWLGILDQCFGLIERFMPGELAEMRTMLHEVIPVGFDAERHLSASYREAVGTMYLTLHPSVMIMTEAVIHEFQHNKFNVAAYSTEFLSNAFAPLYKSPIRPDPRPLWGILLAVHAFLPVAELYRRMRDGGDARAAHPDFERRMAELDLKNHEGMEMLRAHAQLTPAGGALFGELETLERRHLAERTARGLENTPTEVHLA
jgi:HEXXH motif-containing protein